MASPWQSKAARSRSGTRMPQNGGPRQHFHMPIVDEPGHSHAAGWICPPGPRRDARPRRRRSDLAAPREGGARRHCRREAGRSDVPTRSRTRRVRIVTEQSPEALPLYRHSTAHLLAAAVTNLFPGVQCGIGPATDEGFFYDFVVAAAVRAGRPRGDRAEDAASWRRRISSTSGRCGRARRPRRFSPSAASRSRSS